MKFEALYANIKNLVDRDTAEQIWNEAVKSAVCVCKKEQGNQSLMLGKLTAEKCAMSIEMLEILDLD
jgi:hypothetical protein